MDIVPVEKIPVAENVPLDKPMEIFKICLEMQQICADKQGLGISATQVGLPLKLFLVLHPDRFRYYVNCFYTPKGKEKISKSLEGCLSLPGRFFEIENHRWEKIRVEGYELVIEERQPVFKEIDKFFDSKPEIANSIVFQHEIDHQLGKEGLISEIPSAREVILRSISTKEK